MKQLLVYWSLFRIRLSIIENRTQLGMQCRNGTKAEGRRKIGGERAITGFRIGEPPEKAGSDTWFSYARRICPDMVLFFLGLSLSAQRETKKNNQTACIAYLLFSWSCTCFCATSFPLRARSRRSLMSWHRCSLSEGRNFMVGRLQQNHRRSLVLMMTYKYAPRTRRGKGEYKP